MTLVCVYRGVSFSFLPNFQKINIQSTSDYGQICLNWFEAKLEWAYTRVFLYLA